MKAGAIYAISARKPSDPDRIHRWAYVGQTRRSIHLRFRQHMSTPASAAYPLSDLEPQVRAVIKFKRCPDWLLTLAERLVIAATLPIYNGQWNRWNPRRISRARAQAQRAERDRPRLEAIREARLAAEEVQRQERLREVRVAAERIAGTVALSEAVAHLDGMGLEALRTASKRPGFPAPVVRGGPGVASRYALADLAEWHTGRAVRA